MTPSVLTGDFSSTKKNLVYSTHQKRSHVSEGL